MRIPCFFITTAFVLGGLFSATAQTPYVPEGLSRVEALRRAGRYADAEGEYRIIAEPYESEGQRLRYLQAMSAARQSSPDAADVLRDYLSDFPESGEAFTVRRALADLLFSESRWSEAAAQYAAVPPRELSRSERTDCLFRSGYSLFRSGDYAAARPLLETVYASGKRYRAYAAYCLGYMAYLQGRYDAAERMFSDAAADAALARVVPFYRLGAAYSRGDWERVVSQGDSLAEKAVGETASEISRMVAQAKAEHASPAVASSQNKPYGDGVLPPINFSTVSYTPQRPFWVRVGGGWPGSSLLDLYYVPVSSRTGSVGVYANHVGRYPRLLSDAGIKLSALSVRNRAGVRAEHVWARRRLRFEANYAGSIYAPYGIPRLPIGPAAPAYNKRIGYDGAAGRLFFGDRFTDLRRLNFSVEIEGGLYTDRKRHSQYEAGACVRVGKEFLGHRLVLEMEGGLTKGFSAMAFYRNFSFGLKPRWSMRRGIFGFGAGADMIWSDARWSPERSGRRFRVRPVAGVDVSFARWLRLYALSESAESGGDYRSLTQRNPYALGGATGPDTYRWTFAGGVRGAVAEAVNYDLRASYSMLDDYTYFLSVSDASALGRFEAAWDDLKLLCISLKADARFVRGLTFSLGARYIKTFASGSKPSVYGLPRTSGFARLKYETRRGAYVWIRAELLGRTDYGSVAHVGLQRVVSGRTVAASVNLSAGAGCSLGRTVGLFAEAGNLLDRRIYLFDHYPAERLNVVAGLTLSF